MALKMRDDRNGRNNKRRKEDSGRPQTAQEEVTEQHVNGDWNEGLLNNTSHASGAPNNVNMNDDHKRMNHNELEKRRKDRIKQRIAHLGRLLPPMTAAEKHANANSTERNTLAILEKTAEYLCELKDKNDRLLMDKGIKVQAEEIKSLRSEIEEVRNERDKYEQQLKAAGIPLTDDITGGWTFRKFDALNVPCTEDSVVLNLPSGEIQSIKTEDSAKTKKSSKSRRKNTVSVQLENVEKAKSDVELARSTTDQGLRTEGNDMSGGLDQGIISTANMGMLGAGQNMQKTAVNPQFFNTSVLGGNVQQGQGQLLLPAMNIINPAGINAGAINPGAMNPASLNPALLQNFGMDRCNGIVPYMSPNGNISALTQNNAADGFGLLQMAMRDAGITATSMSASSMPVSAQTTNATTVAQSLQTKSSDNSEVATPEASSSPLQSLTSAADGQTPASLSTVAGIAQGQPLNSTASTSTTQALNLNMPIMAPGQCGFMQAFNPNLGLQMMAQNQGMPYNMMQNAGLGGITMMPQQQGQIIYLNEQGIPVISNMPVQGLDAGTMTNNSQMAVGGIKPGCVPGTGMSQMATGQKGQTVLPHVQDSASADSQARDGMAQFQSNLLQAQSQLQTGDMNSQQQCQTQKVGLNPLQNQAGMNMFCNAGDNANALLQVQQQQQLNQQLIQAAQLSNLAPGINKPGQAAPQNVNLLQGKPSNSNNTSAVGGDNLMLPVSQSGNLLTLNHAQQPMQLPSALILPNGQIIPVVTQPQLLMGQNQQPAASVVTAGTTAVQQNVPLNKPAEGTNNIFQGVGLENSAPQIQEGCSVSSSQIATTRQTGLLMTTNTVVTAPNRPVSTSAATLTTTVIPTTVTGSVMTTQVQKHQTMTTQVQQQQLRSGTPNIQPKKQVPGTNTASGNTAVPQPNVPQTPTNIEQPNILSGNNSMTILPNGQFVNNSGAIVLTLPTTTPGQPPTSVLVDPNTMQVLGMLPPQPQQQQQQQNTVPVAPVPAGQQPQMKAQTSAEQTKKSKKGSHRALKPKPPTAKDKSAVTLTSTSNSTSSVSVPGTVSSEQQNNEVASPATSQENNSASSNVDISPTDILAQAAESIFSDIPNFYNPANEDNPLHIDTSAGDTEEDAITISPKKDRLQNSQAIYNKQPSMSYQDMTDPATSPYHFVESPPLSKELSKKSKSKKKSGTAGSQKSGTVKCPSKKLSSGGKNSKKSQQQKEKAEAPPKSNDIKLSGKQKVAPDKESTVDDPPKILETMDILRTNEQGKGQTSPVTQPIEQVHQPTEYQQLFSDESSHGDFSQQETPVDIPETISFTENELSDVLDQVEKLGNSLTEESVAPPAKKSKSRKTKGQTEAGNDDHSGKKRKKTSHDEPDLGNTSLSMDSILASISGAAQHRNAKEESPKKGQDQSNALSVHVEEPALHMPTLTSPSSGVKSVSPSTSKKNKSVSDISTVSNTMDTSLKKTVQLDNGNNPLHIVSSPPQSMSMNDVNKTGGSSTCSTSPSFSSPTLNVSSMHGVSGQKSSGIRNSNENRLMNNDNNMSEFPSFFMADNSDAHQVSPGPQSLPCLSTSGVSMTPTGPSLSQPSNNSATSTSSCKLPSDQQRLSNSSSLPNVPSSLMSPNPRSICSSSSPMETSVHHGPQSLPSSINNQLTYSAESLFSPSSNCAQLNALPDIRGELNRSANPAAPPLMHPTSQVNTQSDNTSPGASRPRTSIYSAENFVQPSMNCESQSVPKSSYSRPQEDFARPASSRGNQMGLGAESFNFSNIASNVPGSNRNRSASNVSTTMTPPSSSSFSFSLGGSSEAANNSFPPHIGHHHFPFYPLHPSVSSSQSTNSDSTPETSRKTGQVDHQPIGFPPFGPDQRSTSFPNAQLNPEQSHLNHINQVPQPPFPNFNPGSESSGTTQAEDNLFHNQPQLGGSSSGNKAESRPVSASNNVRKQKEQSHGRTAMQGTEQQDGRNMERSLFVSTGLPSFYTPIRQQSNGPSPLETPPLHHLPQSSNDTGMSNTYQSSMPNSSHQFNSEFPNVRLEGPSVQMQSGGNPTYSQQNSQTADANKHNRPKAKMPDHHLSRRQGMMSMDTQVASRGSSSRQPPQQHDHRSSQNPGSQTPTSNTHMEQQQAPTPQQTRPQKASSKQSKGQPARSKKSSKQSYNQDLDSTVSHSLFDATQGIPPYFPIANLSPPPSRSAQPDGPTYMPHLFGPSSRSLPNANIAVHKNPAELGGTFNQLFPPVRTQTSIGLNFQPGFGMNPVHGGHGSAAQIKSHSGGVSVTQPMSNFNLTNIFSDVNNCSQSNGGLNISPIKFPHGNAIIPPQPGMDHNSLQHHHQPGMLYHNRTPGPPPVPLNAMSINSLIGHNHPGMGQINNTMGQTFHGYGHPSSFTMPHLNFTMHDH